MKNNKGLTIVALIITVIILIVLAMVAIKEIQGEGIINRAKESRFKQEASKYQEELNITLAQKYMETQEYTEETINDKEQIKQYIPSITQEGLNKFIIDENELAYNGKNEDEIKWCRELNIYICSEFSPERWDKTATSEIIFNWKSDDKTSSDYGVLKGIKDEYKEEYTELIIPSRCTVIEISAFKNNQNITKVKIPSSVTNIGSFLRCTKLEEIEIPGSVKSILSETFHRL